MMRYGGRGRPSEPLPPTTQQAIDMQQTRDDHTRWQLAKQYEIPGQPVGKGRPRFYKRGKYTKVFTPAKTKAFEERVAVYSGGKIIPRDVPVRVECLFVFQRPKRLMRQKDPDGLMLMTSKPDGDNVLKAVLDGLNGIAYQDDAQVADSSFRKRYSEKGQGPRVQVNIYITTHDPQPTHKEREPR